MHDDAHWVHKTLSGDADAFHRLIDTYRQPIYNQILAIVRNHWDAEELTNDVFLKAHQHLASLREPRCFGAWLRQIARHHTVDWLRRRPAASVSLEEVAGRDVLAVAEFLTMRDTTEQHLLREETFGQVLEAMRCLSPKDRALMDGFYVADESYETLQQRYGLTKGTLGRRLSQARQKVRERMRKMFAAAIAVPWCRVAKQVLWGGVKAVKLGIRAKVAIGGIVGLLTCGTVLVWHASQPIVDDQPESGFSKVQAASSASPVDKGSASVGSQDTGATEERVDALFNELREQVEPMDDGSKEQISEGTSQPRATKAVDTSAGTEEAEAPGEEMSREERLHEIETKLLRLAGEYREVMHRRNNLEAAPGTHARSTEFNRLQDIRRQIHNEMLVLAAQYNQLAPGTMGSGFFARLTEGILNFVPIPIEEGLRLRDQL